jgi:hypothetical protein
MTDELKPELKEAMKNLPRERMPAGLEAKVTGAMRDHGFLSRRRRMVAVTGGRVAGLLAACVALVIGAYSIGLHRGGGDAVLPSSIVPAEQQEVKEATLEEPAPSEPRDVGNVAADEVTPAPPKRQETREAMLEKSAATADKAKDDHLVTDTDAARPTVTRRSEPEPEAKEEAALSKRPEGEERMEDAAGKGRRGFAPAEKTPARETLMTQSQAPSAPSSVTPRVLPVPLLMLGDLPVVVDAPDSVRVTQDERGQMILIYTSDGVIRIRPAHNN